MSDALNGRGHIASEPMLTLPAYEHIEVHVPGPDDRFKQITLHHRLTASHIGSMAIDLAKGSNILTVGDGINPDGSQRIRSLTPEEVVTRSVDIAERLFAEMAKRNWTQPIPSLAELRDTDAAKAGFRGPA